jgi:LysR family transcriptional regulator, regulator for bpeEF and oprC
MNLEMFRGLVPFVAVAEARSFRAAAARLGVSAAAVSKAVQQLEKRVGLPLFVRGARTVALTREGEQFFARCREAVVAVDGARESLEPARSLPAGELVISAPFVASTLVAPGLALLRARYPQLAFRLIVTDRRSKLGEEAVDVAVRIGPIAESSVVARRVRRTKLVTVAAPAYLGRRGVPRRASDLARHDCLVLVAPHGRPRPWVFASGHRSVPAALLVDHGPTLVDAALTGLGVTQLFDFMAEPMTREGRLVTVLDDDVGAGPDVHVLCAPGRRAAARVRAAFQAFADAFSVVEDEREGSGAA